MFSNNNATSIFTNGHCAIITKRTFWKLHIHKDSLLVRDSLLATKPGSWFVAQVGAIVRRVFHPARKLVRFSLLKFPNIPNSIFGSGPQWGSVSYRPSAFPCCETLLLLLQCSSGLSSSAAAAAAATTSAISIHNVKYGSKPTRTFSKQENLITARKQQFMAYLTSQLSSYQYTSQIWKQSIKDLGERSSVYRHRFCIWCGITMVKP